MGFACETEHTAAKRHQCDECPAPIEVGQRFIRWAGTTDGDFGTYRAHVECRAAAIALNNLNEIRDADEWMNLSDLESEDHDWLCEEHPIVAERLGLSMYDWREPRTSFSAYFGQGSHHFWHTPHLVHARDTE